MKKEKSSGEFKFLANRDAVAPGEVKSKKHIRPIFSLSSDDDDHAEGWAGMNLDFLKQEREWLKQYPNFGNGIGDDNSISTFGNENGNENIARSTTDPLFNLSYISG